MAQVTQSVRTITGVAADAIDPSALLAGNEPVVLKGAADGWPLVRAGREGSEAATKYIRGLYRGAPVTAYTGEPEIRGRFGYDDALTKLNFTAERLDLEAFLERVAAHRDDPAPPAFYIGSTDVDACLPGFHAANDLAPADAIFAAHPPLVSIWMGNRTVAAAHHDMSNNLAVCAVGRRRFTLFPPEQVANLYPGPLEPTPGGQVISMVDFETPDFERHPGFRDALGAARVAELEPGDVLFLPALWWHQVEALEPFNVLVNYWWNVAPAFMDSPMNTLLHGMLSLRDRAPAEKRAWAALFDYYLFGPAERPAAHLPVHARGPLAPLDAVAARRLRAMLLHKLNR